MIPQTGGSLLETVASWGAAAVAFIGSAALLRRRLSKDRTEIAKDTAEANFVQRLLIERDAAQADAREAWRARQVDAETIARLVSQSAGQAKDIKRMIETFAAFQRKIGRMYPETREFLDTDWHPLPKEKP